MEKYEFFTPSEIKWRYIVYYISVSALMLGFIPLTVVLAKCFDMDEFTIFGYVMFALITFGSLWGVIWYYTVMPIPIFNMIKRRKERNNLPEFIKYDFDSMMAEAKRIRAYSFLLLVNGASWAIACILLQSYIFFVIIAAIAGIATCAQGSLAYLAFTWFFFFPFVLAIIAVGAKIDELWPMIGILVFTNTLTIFIVKKLQNDF